MLNQIEELHKQGLSSYKIAKIVGLSPTNVRLKLSKLGLSAPIKRKEYNCTNCGKLIAGRGKKFCSHACMGEYKRTLWLDDWVNGAESQVSEPKSLKKALYTLRGAACELCGWDKVHPLTGNIPVEVHHIDGDATNNKYSNLQLLCPNCHSLTPNHGYIGSKESTRPSYVKKRNSHRTHH